MGGVELVADAAASSLKTEPFVFIT